MMKCDGLNAYKADVTIPVYGTIADADVYLKDKADEAIAELKAKLESVQASMYCDVVEAGMENRRLKRAMYKACANWAACKSCLLDYVGLVIHAKMWERTYNKCLKKAEEYK